MGRECGRHGSEEEYVQRICGVTFSRNTLRNHLHMMGFVITAHVGMRKNLVRLTTYHMSVMLYNTCTFLHWLG